MHIKLSTDFQLLEKTELFIIFFVNNNNIYTTNASIIKFWKFWKVSEMPERQFKYIFTTAKG